MDFATAHPLEEQPPVPAPIQYTVAPAQMVNPLPGAILPPGSFVVDQHGNILAPTPRKANPSQAFLQNLAPRAPIVQAQAPRQEHVFAQPKPVVQVSQASNVAHGDAWYSKPIHAVYN